MNRKEISRFTIGGTTSGPSVPDEVMQRALGSKIRINTWSHTYHVPTPDGFKIACKGDTIIAYDDGSFDVEFVKKDYRIAVTWGMCGFVDVEANSLEEAIQKVQDDVDDYALPDKSDYVDGSFWTATDDPEEMAAICVLD